jgi:hypothetical protein
MNGVLNVNLGFWRITVYGLEYLVDVTEFSTYKDGSLSGKYVACWNGYKSNAPGTFCFNEIEKMEKVT